MADYPTSFDREALLACARGELFGPGNAQLPEPPMLMMDRITSSRWCWLSGPDASASLSRAADWHPGMRVRPGGVGRESGPVD